MRTLVALSATALLAGCTSTVFAQPVVHVSPYLAVYQVRGDVALQSEPVPGAGLQDNAAQTMRTFGQDRHHEDVGVRADVGDGFAGFRVDYYKLEQNTSHVGALTADWGNLLATDVVRMRVEMDELRIGYLEPLPAFRTTWRDRPLTLRTALGGMFTMRDLDLRARTDDGQRTQNVQIEGDLVSIAARVRASWRDFAIDADYAISPELSFGGDFDGLLQDLELRGSYTMPLHDVSFFAGYRLSTFEAKGHAGAFAYGADLIIDGFQVGVSVSF
jgi:hypothetical protein